MKFPLMISISKETYHQIMEQLSPADRFIDVENVKAPHFWLYSPDQMRPIYFIVAPIQKLESMKVENFA